MDRVNNDVVLQNVKENRYKGRLVRSNDQLGQDDFDYLSGRIQPLT